MPARGLLYTRYLGMHQVPGYRWPVVYSIPGTWVCTRYLGTGDRYLLCCVHFVFLTSRWVLLVRAGASVCDVACTRSQKRIPRIQLESLIPEPGYLTRWHRCCNQITMLYYNAARIMLHDSAHLMPPRYVGNPS